MLVVEVCQAEEQKHTRAHLADVVSFLWRHGVEAEPQAVVATAQKVGRELDNITKVFGADLIVAGAYGHTRLGEWAFAGVTRDLLRHPQRYVLLSH